MVATYNPFEGVAEEEIDKALYSLIDSLPAQRKKVFMLCKLEGKSYNEVSAMLGISVAAVNDHITKANKFLKTNYAHVAPLMLSIFFALRS
ncbi:sigma-70 family RNA polymerase sigma factor [Sphingobacterium sp. KU25419]|nr:sigma-70 family RNA polymerase sigma factor [Sphingobacterium sp. KU25419]